MKKYALIALLTLASSTPAFAEGIKPSFPSMAIKGQGEYKVKPDYAIFNLAVETRNTSTEKALTQHAAKIEKVSALLESLKAEGLKVESADFSSKTEQRMMKEEQPRRTDRPLGPPEYVATTIYTLRTDQPDKKNLEKIASLLSTGDLYTLRSAAFRSNEPRKAHLEARKNAVRDAREQAEAYASAASIKLLEIVDITDSDASDYRHGDSGNYFDLPSRRSASGKWLKVSEIIPPETLSFNAGVNIMWKIAPKE